MKIEDLKKLGKIHMIGIGGVSMSGLAEHLSHFGFTITGSDQKESENTIHLKELGMDITIGHDKEKVEKSDLIVYTAAIPKSDEEYVYAKEKNKKMMERSEFLGEITKCYEECICISGTHGKTTTTSMIATCFLEAKKEPTIEVGAYLDKIKGNNKTGSNKYFILEACEYVDSFLKFHPTTAIILNIDNDHLDYFKNIENIKKSFLEFTTKVRENGIIIGNIDDKNTQEVLSKTSKKIITFGIKNENANYKATNINQKEEYQEFDVLKNKEYFETFKLKVKGSHNILNALATIATCDYYQLDKETIKEGLKKFKGAKRRFELIGYYKDIKVFDDYAHHPTEILSTYDSANQIPHHETWAVFEPHTYSRTKEHLKEFASILSKFDHIILADIYAARETNTLGISSKDLETKIKETNENCIYLNSYEKIITYLKENIKKEDIIITIGAGTINQIGYQLIK